MLATTSECRGCSAKSTLATKGSLKYQGRSVSPRTNIEKNRNSSKQVAEYNKTLMRWLMAGFKPYNSYSIENNTRESGRYRGPVAMLGCSPLKPIQKSELRIFPIPLIPS